MAILPIRTVRVGRRLTGAFILEAFVQATKTKKPLTTETLRITKSFFKLQKPKNHYSSLLGLRVVANHEAGWIATSRSSCNDGRDSGASLNQSALTTETQRKP
jgi:hypothetical protein